MNLKELIDKSLKIREKYHKLEEEYHNSKWTIEEDTIAFLTDSSLVGRMIMDKQGRWPINSKDNNLDEKIGECVWWLVVLAKRTNLNFEECVEKFLKNKEEIFEN